MKPVDAILNCRWVIPIEPHEVIHSHYSIVIDKGKILDLLPQHDATQHYHAVETHRLDDHAVLPGFINTHTHSPMVLFRGLADDLPLMEWLNNHIWPAEAKWLSEEFIFDGTELALMEMVKGGTTCFNEHFFFPKAIATATLESQLRACIGATIINFPNNWSKNENDAFAKFLEFYTEYKQHHLISTSLAPHAPYTTSDNILKTIQGFSDSHQLTIHMHLQETAQEVEESIKNFGKRPVQRLWDLGLLSNRFQAVHMTQVTQDDIDLLQSSGSHVIHCPESNLKLASGLCPVETLSQHQINVTLGTDGAASNNDLDMISEMRTAALLGKMVAKNATAVKAAYALKMATLNGAIAMGLQDKIGSVTPGKEADLIAINLSEANTQPTYNPISQIVYSANKSQITDMWVAGCHIMKNRELKTIDENKVLSTAKKWQQRLQ